MNTQFNWKAIFSPAFFTVAVIAGSVVIGASLLYSGSSRISFSDSQAAVACEGYTSQSSCVGTKACEWYGLNGAAATCHIPSCGGLLNVTGKADTRYNEGGCFPNGAPSGQGWVYAGFTNDCGAVAGNTSKGCFYRAKSSTSSTSGPVASTLDSCGGTLNRLGKADSSKFYAICHAPKSSDPGGSSGWTYAGKTSDCDSVGGCFYKSKIPTPTPGPTYSVAPGTSPSKTPQVSSVPANEAPVSSESSTPLPTTRSPGSGVCTGGANPSGTCNGICFCGSALQKAIHGVAVDMAKLNATGNVSPRQTFSGGGSENIPTTCQAAKYWIDGNPAWFNEYLDIQLSGSVPLFGKEVFSPYYMSLSVSDVIAVRKKAEQLGQADLERKASQWLKAYWASLALMASQNSVRRIEYSRPGGFGSDSISGSIDGGYGLALPGNRGYVNRGGGGDGLQHTFLSAALGHPGREFGFTLDTQPPSAGGLCSVFKSLNYPISSGGKVNFSVNPPARDFGLTTGERSTLANFISSGGKSGLSSVLGMLGGYKLACDLTVVRTDQGISAWFGTPNGKTGMCSYAKGGTFAAATLNYSTSTTSYLSRATQENYPEAATVWVEDNQICEESSQLPKQCIPMAGGNKVYQVVWPRGGRPSAQ